MQSRSSGSTEPWRNSLLSALDAEEYSELLEDAEKVDLKLRTVLYEANGPITHVLFLIRGVASIIAPVGDGTSVEVGTVGSEGFVGLPLLFGVDREPAKAIIQVADGGVRVTAAAFQKAVADSAALRGLFLRYAQSYMSQVSQSSACNRAHSIEERCARWLLMTHDRVAADEFPLTHEFLSLMLGVRRAGVTVAASMLQKAGLIEYTHGRVKIIDREGLEEAACACYQIIRNSYGGLSQPLSH
ncbi:MAG TPA: Crp/Fnr family transcriptional regulator [Gemmatimonadaceae bacterium]|jgi:CRP-like cAMP-binding protein